MSADPSFCLLGCDMRAEARASVSVTDACIEASEVYEFGMSLNNSVYRSRVLLPLKLLHALRLGEVGCVDACLAYLEELKEGARALRASDSLLQQLRLTEDRLQQSGESECVCGGGVRHRREAGRGGFLSQLFSAVDKGINSFMSAVEEKEEKPADSAVSSVPSVPLTPTMPVTPAIPAVPVTPVTPALPVTPQSQAPIPTAPVPAPSGFRGAASRGPHRHVRNSLPKAFVPFVPAEPVAPTPSAEPATPVPSAPMPQPIQPIQPIQPVQPIQSVQPTQPIQPTQPVQSVQPLQPTQPMQHTHPIQPTQPKDPTKPKEQVKPKEVEKPKEEERSGWSLFGSLFGRSDTGKKVYKVELPKNEVKPYYDEAKKKWIIPGMEEEEEKAPLPPPPPMEIKPVQPPANEPPMEEKPKEIAPPMPAIKPFVPTTPMAEEKEEEKEKEAEESHKPGRRRDGRELGVERNRRVAKSRPKGKPMNLYTSAFCCVC